MDDRNVTKMGERQGRLLSEALQALRWRARPGIHTRAPSGFPYEGPAMDFHTAVPGWAFEQRVYVSRATIRRSQDGPSSAGPDRTLSRQVLTGTSVSGPRQIFKQRAPAGPLVGGPQSGFKRAGPAGLSVG